MRQDVWKCFFVGLLCFWLFWDVIEIKNPTVRIEEGILKEQEEADREILKGEKFNWGDFKLYFNKRQYLDIPIVWITKGCILLLVFSLIKRTQ